jgi:hypothetical protein
MNRSIQFLVLLLLLASSSANANDNNFMLMTRPAIRQVALAASPQRPSGILMGRDWPEWDPALGTSYPFTTSIGYDPQLLSYHSGSGTVYLAGTTTSLIDHVIIAYDLNSVNPGGTRWTAVSFPASTNYKVLLDEQLVCYRLATPGSPVLANLTCCLMPTATEKTTLTAGDPTACWSFFVTGDSSFMSLDSVARRFYIFSSNAARFYAYDLDSGTLLVDDAQLGGWMPRHPVIPVPVLARYAPGQTAYFLGMANTTALARFDPLQYTQATNGTITQRPMVETIFTSLTAAERGIAFAVGSPRADQPGLYVRTHDSASTSFISYYNVYELFEDGTSRLVWFECPIEKFLVLPVSAGSSATAISGSSSPALSSVMVTSSSLVITSHAVFHWQHLLLFVLIVLFVIV